MHLTILDLQHNELDTLPTSIETLNKLTKLDLFHNCFKRLPREIALLFELKVWRGEGVVVKECRPRILWPSHASDGWDTRTHARTHTHPCTTPPGFKRAGEPGPRQPA